MAKKTSKKKVATDMVTLDGKEMTRAAGIKMMTDKLQNAKNPGEKKRIRSVLRLKLNHSGGLRLRTYVDKRGTGERVEVGNQTAKAKK